MEELDWYPWGGHSVLVGRVKGEWQEREYVLRQFGEKRQSGVRAYRKFMEGGKGQGRGADLIGGGLIHSLGGWSQVQSLRVREGEVEHCCTYRETKPADHRGVFFHARYGLEHFIHCPTIE